MPTRCQGPPGMGGSNNEIKGRDLSTSVTTTWIYRLGSNLYVMGTGSGSIIVGGYGIAGSYLWAVTGPEQAQAITVPETGDVPSASGLVADGKGWWLGSLDGIYRWTPRTGAVLVSESLAAPAGACA